MDACLRDVSGQIDEADAQMTEFYDSAVVAEKNGDSESARSLFDRAHNCSKRSMQLVKKARSRALELEASL